MKYCIVFFGVLLVSCICCAIDLVPTPHELEKNQGTITVNPHALAVILSERKNDAAIFAAEMLKRHTLSLPRTQGKTIRFYLAEAGDKLFAGTELENLKLGRPQEYLLQFVSTPDAVDVYGAGADAQGIFYAAATLKQLLASDGLHMQSVHDYPDWRLRYIGGYNPVSLKQMEQLATAKINGYGIQHRYDWRKFSPEERPIYGKKHTYREWFEQIRSFREKSGALIDFMMMLNVYCGKRIDASREEDLEFLIRQCRFAAEYVQEIMIQFDDYTPMDKSRYVFVSEGEKKKFRNPGHSHAYIVRRVADALRKDHPSVRISVCPAPYSLINHNATSPSNRAYLEAMSRELPKEVRVVWTGPAVESARVTEADYRNYQKLLNGHELYLWDNTSSTGALPMNIWETSFFPEMSSRDGRIYINGHAFSFFWTWLYAVNANDYLWNPQKYDAARSYAACYRLLKGEKMPDIITRTREDIIRMKRTWERSERAAIAKRILDQKQEFLKHKLDFSRIERTAKQVYEESSAEIRTGTIPKLSRAPKLDGTGGDPVWLEASVFPLAPAHYTSEVKAGYTKDSLFILFKGKYAKASTATRKLEHDSNLRDSDDVFTIGLQPPLANRRAGWIAFDRDGNQTDNKEWQPADKFNPRIRKKLQVYPEYWILEVEIPFAELAKHIMWRPPVKGTTWNLNFVRRNRLDGEISAWAPAPEKQLIHKKYFGTVTFQ